MDNLTSCHCLNCSIDVQCQANHNGNFESNILNTFQQPINPLILLILITEAIYLSVQKKIVYEILRTNVLPFLISIILWPIVLIIGLFFTVVKFSVGVALRLKYGEKFGGLLSGADRMWAIEDESKSIINALLVLNLTDHTAFELYKSVKKRIELVCFKQSKEFPKFTSIRRKELGYDFFLKDEYIIEDCVKYVEVPPNNTQPLDSLISKICNQELPKNNSGLWEIMILDRPIQWHSDRKYGIICRLHHSMADGFSILQFLVKHFSDTSVEMDTNILKNIPRQSCTGMIITNLRHLLLGPAVVLSEIVTRQSDVNILHNTTKLSGEKIVGWITEENVNLVPSVKKIRKSRPNLTFSDVVLTALSATFCDYYQEKSRNRSPEFITAVIPALMSHDYGSCAKLENNFSVGMLNLTVNPSKNISKRLEKVARANKRLKESPDYLINLFVLNVLSAILPERLLRSVLHSAHCTMVVSNLPGPSKLSLFDGRSLEDIVFWIPHRGTTGVGVSVLTYDRKFQIGLVVDKVLIKDQREVQHIIESVFSKLQELSMFLIPDQN